MKLYKLLFLAVLIVFAFTPVVNAQHSRHARYDSLAAAHAAVESQNLHNGTYAFCKMNESVDSVRARVNANGEEVYRSYGDAHAAQIARSRRSPYCGGVYVFWDEVPVQSEQPLQQQYQQQQYQQQAGADMSWLTGLIGQLAPVGLQYLLQGQQQGYDYGYQEPMIYETNYYNYNTYTNTYTNINTNTSYPIYPPMMPGCTPPPTVCTSCPPGTYPPSSDPFVVNGGPRQNLEPPPVLPPDWVPFNQTPQDPVYDENGNPVGTIGGGRVDGSSSGPIYGSGDPNNPPQEVGTASGRGNTEPASTPGMRVSMRDFPQGGTTQSTTSTTTGVQNPASTTTSTATAMNAVRDPNISNPGRPSAAPVTTTALSQPALSATGQTAQAKTVDQGRGAATASQPAVATRGDQTTPAASQKAVQQPMTWGERFAQEKGVRTLPSSVAEQQGTKVAMSGNRQVPSSMTATGAIPSAKTPVVNQVAPTQQAKGPAVQANTSDPVRIASEQPTVQTKGVQTTTPAPQVPAKQPTTWGQRFAEVPNNRKQATNGVTPLAPPQNVASKRNSPQVLAPVAVAPAIAKPQVAQVVRPSAPAPAFKPVVNPQPAMRPQQPQPQVSKYVPPAPMPTRTFVPSVAKTYTPPARTYTPPVRNYAPQVQKFSAPVTRAPAQMPAFRSTPAVSKPIFRPTAPMPRPQMPSRQMQFNKGGKG